MKTCSRCQQPLEGTMVGDGDGNGKRFAHPECYYRARCNELEARVKTLERELGRHTSGTQIEGDYADQLALARHAVKRLESALRECVADWRDQAVAEENSQRAAGNMAMMACNARGASTYRHCADDLEQSAALASGEAKSATAERFLVASGLRLSEPMTRSAADALAEGWVREHPDPDRGPVWIFEVVRELE